MGANRSAPVVVVTGTDRPLGRGLAGGLAGSAAAVVPLAADELGSRSAAEDAVARVLADHGSLDGIVHAAVDPIAFEAVPIHEVDDARWDAVWEQTLRRTLFVLQAGFGAMRRRGGAIVVVLPVIGMTGAAGLAPYAAALEGVRLLAKSAARQWGPDGIRVNCLAVAPEHVPVGVTSGALALFPPALGGPGDPGTDLAPIVAWLLGDDAHFVTGVTVCADGGVWMAP